MTDDRRKRMGDDPIVAGIVHKMYGEQGGEVMKFTVEINLGNDAMRSGSDIAGVLTTVAWKLEEIYGANPIGRPIVPILITDANGAVVGKASVTEGEA